jgi:hypothetical protein
MHRLFALLVLLPAVARAQDEPRQPQPQRHEVRVDVDISTYQGGNSALVDAQYTFTPESLDRGDEVVPYLRRFVRHPSAVWARILRFGTTDEQVTGARLGGILQLASGRVYASGEAGIEVDSIDNDPAEPGYWAAAYTVEAGARPVELLSIGAFYSGRPVLSAKTTSNLVSQTSRDGNEHRIGGTLTASTANDRLYLTLSGWDTIADYTFTGIYPGPITVRGGGVSARIAYQATSTLSFQIRGLWRHEHWVDTRTGDDGSTRVGVNTDRTINYALGNLEVIYWFRGRVGFRAGVGGGYSQSPPYVNLRRETAIAQLGLGLVSRF